ncbi:hypothetical protein LC593_10615 [Nostoc sp. CHAB 5844]|nr:hypothetical protein [Nostoc sp. CHAB 5844]
MANPDKLLIITPDFYWIFCHRDQEWFLYPNKVVYRTHPIYLDFNDTELMYGLTKLDIVGGLTSAANNADGYYLANLRKREYYYCGDKPENVVALLQEFGIGRVDPMEA